MELLNKITLGDCLEVMKVIPDKYIDMILCDLPYGVTAQNPWDEVISFDPLWAEYKRIIKNNAAVVLTAIQPFASQLITSNINMFRYDLIWEKNKSTGFLNAKKMPLRKHEHILVFYKKLPTYNPQKTFGHKAVNSYNKINDGTNYGKTKIGVKGGGQTDRYPNSILKIPVVNNDSEERFCSTQKPVALFEYLIKTYTNPGNIVLDSCVGSGTTCIAARNLGRQFIGIEKDPIFCEIAQKRLNG